MNLENLNNNDKIFKGLFENFEMETVESDWIDMKSKLELSANHSIDNENITAASSNAISRIVSMKKLFFLFVISSLLAVSILYFNNDVNLNDFLVYQDNKGNNVLTDNKTNYDASSQHQSKDQIQDLTNQSKNNFIENEALVNKDNTNNVHSNTNQARNSSGFSDKSNTTRVNSFAKNNSFFNVEEGTKHNESNDIPFTGSGTESTGSNSFDNLDNNQTDFNQVAFNSEHNNANKFTDSGNARNQGSPDIIGNFNEKDDVFKDILNKVDNRTLLHTEFLTSPIHDKLDFGMASLDLTKPNLRPGYKFLKKWQTYLFLDFRYRSLNFFGEEIDVNRYNGNLELFLNFFTLGLEQEYRFNDKYSISAGISHLRINIFPHIHEEASVSTFGNVELNWKYRRVENGVFGIDIPVRFSYNPKSKISLIERSKLSFGITNVIPLYVFVEDTESVEQFGTLIANRPEGWERPEIMEGIKNYDLGLSFGYRFHMKDRIHLGIIYNQRFRKIVNSDFYRLENPRNTGFQRRSIQLQILRKF